MPKLFRIKKVSYNTKTFLYRVDQRHSIFLFSFWDQGSYDLSPNYLFNTKEEALKAIANLVTEYV